MAEQHTKGPWTITQGSYGALYVGPAKLEHPSRDRVLYNTQRGRDLLAQRAADAALIATSPKMLGTLERLVAAWDAFESDGPAPLDPLIAEARTLIAEATATAP